MAPAPLPAGDARRRGGRRACAARRPNGGGQDAVGLPRQPGRPDPAPARGAAHALRVALEGVGDRRAAQPALARRGDGGRHPRRGAHRRHPLRPQGAAAGAAAAHAADHARVAVAAAEPPGCGHAVRGAAGSGGGRGARLRHGQARRPARAVHGAAAEICAGDAAGGALRNSRRCRCLSRLARARWRHRCGAAGDGRSRRRAQHPHPAARGSRPLVGPFRPLCRRAGDAGDRGAPHHDRLLQHAQPGRADLPGSVGGERGTPADRRPPRQPLDRGAAQGGGGDGGGPPARAGRHRQPRSGGGLGRCGPRHPDGRAQGLVAPVAADRPCQPPAGRAERGGARARQPLRISRGARGAGCGRGRRARSRYLPLRQPRRAGAAHHGLRLRRALPRNRHARRGAIGAALFGADRRAVRPCAGVH